MIVLAAEGISALGINLPGLVAQLINFGIVFIGITILCRRVLFPMLDERKRRIEEGLQASEEAKERLSQTEQDVQAEIATARQEAQGLITQAQQVSARLQEESRQSARAEADQLLERARSEIQLERDSAIAEIRKEFGELAVTAAEKVVRRSLDRDAHSDLIEQVLAEAPRPGAGDGGTPSAN
jgi:F-type H+-transporting ATPase subunit b